MISLPMRRTSGSSTVKRSCSSRWSVSDETDRTMFSKGSSSRSSWATSERSSWSSNMTAVRSNGRSSVPRSRSTGGGSWGWVSAVVGAVGAGVSPGAVASGVSGVSVGTSSRSGFSSSSFWTTSWSSSVDSCSSWIACCSSGVMTTRWLCRRESLASIAIVFSLAPGLERELLSQVDLPGYRIRCDLTGGACDENFAVVHDVGPVGDPQCLADVVVGDEDPDTFLTQAADDFLDVADRDRIDARERLVEQQVLGRRDEGARDLEPAPLAARPRVGCVRRQSRQPELGQQLGRPLAPLRRRQVEGLENGQQVLLHRELPEDRRLLWEIAYAQ